MACPQNNGKHTIYFNMFVKKLKLFFFLTASPKEEINNSINLR